MAHTTWGFGGGSSTKIGAREEGLELGKLFTKLHKSLGIIVPYTLPSIKLTAISALKIGLFCPKRNGSSSNHPFSGVNSLLVLGRVAP